MKNYLFKDSIVYLGLGSNLGNSLQNCIKAIDLIRKVKNIKLILQSSFYKTEPIGLQNQKWFINTVIKIKTNIKPKILLRIIKNIEFFMGRQKTIKWGPRIIDIDILFYNSLIINDNKLHIPHLEISKRLFVLYPLLEIDKLIIHPILNLSIGELIKKNKNNKKIIKLRKRNMNKNF